MSQQMYQTTSSNYDPKWKIFNDQNIVNESVPSHKELYDKYHEIKKAKIEMLKQLNTNSQ